jgi:tol-pal system protein YbgF
MNSNRLPTVLLAAAIVAATPAHAGMFDDEEARARIDRLQRDITPRVEKLEAGQRAQLELANQIEALKAEVARLRGQVEVLTHDLDQAQKRQKDFYVDLDNRLRKQEQGAAETKAAEKPAEPPKPDPAVETKEYEAALNLFKSAKYKESASAFESFLKTYPASAFQANAHYWLGNALFQLKDYRRAMDAFRKVSTAWPKDAKAADAMLGLSNCQQELGDAKGARGTLEAIVAKYPGSQAAQIAKDRLKRDKG